MAIEIKSPQFPESVADGTVATWHKKAGEKVSRDELLVDIETDKVVLEVVAPADGYLENILKNEGDTVESLEVMATLSTEASAGSASSTHVGSNEDTAVTTVEQEDLDLSLSPAVRRLISEHNLSEFDIKSIREGTSKGRITKEDVQSYIANKPAAPVSSAKQDAKTAAKPAEPSTASPSTVVSQTKVGDREEKRVPMTRLRSRVAERLMQAKNNTAMLTTFNEVNMKPVMTMRSNYKDAFEKEHGVRLGFMSFFVRAVVEALKKFPEVNASMDGSDIVYHGFYDVGVAVSSNRGLVVPIIRDADQKRFAEIESNIVTFGKKAKEGKLTIEEMTGGTFTISNGGVFGSLLSTPILNPPQTAILGMHKIQERPMAVDGEVVILPMMYLALSYDHRMIDGKEAVQFLVTIKDLIEDPGRLLLDI